MLLTGHLEQIATSAKTIGDLEFPPSRNFTNALLGQHEITTLIRDTEPHERSLFTVNPNISYGTASDGLRAGSDAMNRRSTLGPAQQKQGSAVAKVLGNDMLRQIQQSSRSHGRSRRVDVEVLLQGAERLCVVYPVSGARERISRLRSQHKQVAESISHYENLVLKQQARLSRTTTHNQHHNDLDQDETKIATAESAQVLTEEELRMEEEEIRELEARKKALEDRVTDIEKDLGGLLR